MMFIVWVLMFPEQKDYGNLYHARLALEDSVVVPPHSEVFLKGYIDRTSQGGVGIFEPNEKLLTKGLFVGRTLVDTTSGKSNIPVMNINDHQPCKIPCEAYIGTIQPVSRVSQLGVANPSVTLRAPQM